MSRRSRHELVELDRWLARCACNWVERLGSDQGGDIRSRDLLLDRYNEHKARAVAKEE
jgi:hypothetical protein